MKKAINLIILVLTSCSLFSQVEIDKEQWKSDLEFIDSKVKKLHPKLKQCKDLVSWQNRVDSINQIIPKLSDNEIIVEFGKLLTTLQDGHTRLLGNHITKKWFPIRIKKFSDGYFITSIDEKYSEIFGAKILQIGNFKPEEAFSLLSDISSGDNPYASTFFNSGYFSMNSILNGLHITEDENKLSLKIEKNGKTLNYIIEAQNYKSHPFYTWFWLFDQAPSESCVTIYNKKKNLPLYLKNHTTPFWFEYIENKKTIYVAVNQSVDGFLSFSDSLWRFIDNNNTEKLIIDLRKNFGGTNSFFMPFIYKLIQHPNLNKKENLFVLISPNTFSAAVHFALWLETHCNPTFVGMPTAAGANHYADPNVIELPNSKILLWISTHQWQLTVPTDKRLWIEPDIKIEMQSDDYFNGRDIVLDKILGN